MSDYRDDIESRQQVVDTLRYLVDSGLTSGSSGNVSVRTDTGMLVTPTGIVPADLQPADIVCMALDGTEQEDQRTPSSEWRIHADIYANKPGLNGVVHCHSNYATILACARRSIPPQHYMAAATGAYEIPLADYATFGTPELSESVLAALEGSLACLMANHGQITTAPSLDGALKLAELVEEQAQWYWGTLAIGGPELLSREQMDDVLVSFASYGQQKK